MKQIISLYEETVKNCSNVIEHINNTINTERLSENKITNMTSRFIGMSPKKFGTFTECLTRHEHGFQASDDSAYDALSNTSKKIEIKSSRVIITNENSNAKNMFQSLEGLETSLSSFEQLFTGNFICNIQQVKPTEFDVIYYSLFLNDIILEFSMQSSEISKQAQNQEAALLLFIDELKEIKHSESKHIINSLLKLEPDDTAAILKCLGEHCTTTDSHKKIREFFFQSELFEVLYTRSKMGYSDKQHRGNEGEGQFHIKSTNIHYHLANNFSKAYTYHDFYTSLMKTPTKQQAKKNSKKP